MDNPWSRFQQAYPPRQNPAMFSTGARPGIAEALSVYLRQAPVQQSRIPVNGLREDGAEKQAGYFGAIPNGLGDTYSTELSINVDGRSMPMMVPGLTKQELDFVMAPGLDPRSIPRSIMHKIIEHADQREKQGRGAFWEPGDMIYSTPGNPARRK